ncbi:casparian strip membrane protein 2-like [Phragmites australis]|uniref:casparian strip membrane protein 2-like n=1 Tax=Phragmites australis TaxID=29695 RepID=UPI002D7874E3|nr:casparian strip membrane protein 2-like [Phragmites australis]
MNGSTSEAATVIHMDDGKAPVAPPPAAGAAASASDATAPSSAAPAPRKAAVGGGLPFLLRSGADGFRRCLAVIDFLLRVAAFGPTLAAAISTGTSDERLSVFTQFFQFHARFDDFPAFTFFMVGNAIAAGYLVLSLPFSAVGIIRPKATGVRLFLLVCDVVMMLLLTAAGAAAAAIVYVAHWGNRRANWVPICMQFHGFCQRTSGAVVASFLAVLVFIVLILMAVCAIRRR